MTKSDQAVTKKCKPYKVDKQYINPMRLNRSDFPNSWRSKLGI